MIIKPATLFGASLFLTVAGLAVLITLFIALPENPTATEQTDTLVPLEAEDSNESSEDSDGVNTGPRQMELDVAYGNEDEQKYDVYYREGMKDAPVVIIVHGGGLDGDKNTMRGRAGMYVDFGAVAMAPNYTHGELGFGGGAYDIACSIASLAETVEQYGGDPHNIIVHGHSGGGHDSSAVTYIEAFNWLEHCPISEQNFTIVGFVGESTGYGDVIPAGTVVTRSERTPLIIEGPEDLVRLLRSQYNEGGSNDAIDGAINYIDPQDPPALLIHGTKDALWDYNRPLDFAEVLNNHGIDAEVELIQGGPHILDVHERPNIVRIIEEFFATTTNK